MSKAIKNQSAILSKLGIEQLNPMQEEAKLAIHASDSVVLLSPTGTGKTLAFLLPLVETLDPANADIQAMIIVPSRELAIQIEQVFREMGTGYKVNAFYGGRNFSKDRQDLNHPPAVLVGTPGRIADHLRRQTFSVQSLTTLVLDEFDKSLEVGFEDEMQEIVGGLPFLSKRILTSATKGVEIPPFVKVEEPIEVNFLDTEKARLNIKIIASPEKDKLPTLLEALCNIGNEPGIVFLNYKDSIQRVSDFLDEKGISHGCFYGGLEQRDRERALIKFRNGTHQLLLATDLAARGIDIPEIKFIIHYHLPIRSEEFTHRNGRTARMHKEGTAYVIQWEEEELPDFVNDNGLYPLDPAPLPKSSGWSTLFVSGGRKDKISKGDIAGLFIKQGKLDKDELGVIELKQDCAFVAVKSSKVKGLLKVVNNVKLKKKKVRIIEI